MDSFIIKHPHITERSGSLNVLGNMCFMVKREATKPEIKKAVKAVYKVDVVAVNVDEPSRVSESVFRAACRARRKDIAKQS